MNKKDHITRTALHLFAEQGYGHTSIAMIAKKAQVSQGLMYNYYRSKEELLEAILMEGLSDIQHTMAAYGDSKIPQDALRRHIMATFDTVEEHAEYWRLFHSIRLQQSVRTQLGTAFRSAQDSILKTLAANFRKLGYARPTEEARLFFAHIDGLVGLYLADPQQFSLHKMQKALFQKYIL